MRHVQRTPSVVWRTGPATRPPGRRQAPAAVAKPGHTLTGPVSSVSEICKLFAQEIYPILMAKYKGYRVGTPSHITTFCRTKGAIDIVMNVNSQIQISYAFLTSLFMAHLDTHMKIE